MTGSTETTKRPGRPKTGVTQENAGYVWQAINSWALDIDFITFSRRLDQWLQDQEQGLEAIEAFRAIDTRDQDYFKALDQWRKEWLTESGWKRLRANIRQRRYTSGKTKGGERKKTLQLEASTVTDLKAFADSHNMTINQAIKMMLDSFN